MKLERVRELEGKRIIHVREMYKRASHLERLKVVTGLLAKNVFGLNFLDVGCAEGLFCGIAKVFGAKRIVGLDVSSSKLKRARETFLCEFYKVNCEKSLKSFYNSFDFVLCSEVLQHIIDYKKVVGELINCIDKSGFILITTSNLSKHKESMGYPLLRHEYAEIDSSMSTKTLLGKIGGGGLSKNSVWRFNTFKLEQELTELFPLKTIEHIGVETPDKKIKELFTVLLFKCERN